MLETVCSVMSRHRIVHFSVIAVVVVVCGDDGLGGVVNFTIIIVFSSSRHFTVSTQWEERVWSDYR